MHPYSQDKRKFLLSSLYEKLVCIEFGKITPSRKTICSLVDFLSEKQNLSLQERTMISRSWMLKCMHEKYKRCLALQKSIDFGPNSKSIRPVLKLNFEIYRLGRFVLQYDRKNYPALRSKLKDLNRLIQSM